MKYFFPILALLLVSCAIGPTPERIGFNYPEAGVRFSPRRHVTCDTVRGQVATTPNPVYKQLFQRTICDIESADTRLLVSGIEGQLTENRQPLFYEIGEKVHGSDKQYNFNLVEEREIEVPWPGLASETGILRTWEMTPAGGGEMKHTYGVIVENYGNTMEFLWRDSVGNAPDDDELEKFFYWTHGLRFSAPEVGEERD